ncbi:hypothetical protein EZI54_04450 [Marinobacter halodurans]|uniref:Aldose 1-epimerase n=1 Tax=Marinobacter halodurans TaxID=2528979 RepID=A0ABY1ZNH1_9GAMM|nr:hypothetical protein [Marinobacter halodurans]TBW58112.1 hypothetical protein EZI54_04450 [Marinobacter halodurans]
MAHGRITESRFGDYPTRVLTLPDGDARAEIALRGATLLSLTLPTAQGPESVLGGYNDPADFTALTGARSAILAPYSNRLAGGQYTFDGVTHAFARRDNDGNSLHGLVMDAAWHPTQETADEDRAVLELATDQLLAGDAPGYPFQLALKARFTLSRDGLRLDLIATNQGAVSAPVGLGWHPYLETRGRDIRDAHLTLPCHQGVVTDERLIPLPGADGVTDLTGTASDFSGDGRSINNQAIDRCFVGAPREDWLYSRLHDPATRLTLELAQSHGVVQVYTGHSLPHRQYDGLAIEPNEFMPDAFNRPELANAIRLGPGRERTLSSHIRIVPDST